MLLERNQALVGLLAAAAIGVGTIFAVFLSAGAFVAGYPVQAEFANAAGIGSGDDVLVAGVRAGKVTDVRLVGDRIVIDLSTTAELPVDSRARIVNKNVLGARAVELVAGDDWDRLLEDQEDPRIPLERTDVPVDLPELGDETVALLRDADAASFADLVVSLADVTEDQREEVGALLDGLQEFAGIVADDRDDLRTLIEDSETVVGALADRDDELVRIMDAFGTTVDELAARREAIRRLLADVRDASSLTADLLGEERAALDRVLGEVDVLLDLVDRHQVDIAHAVAYGGVAFEGFASVGRSGTADNPYWGNILVSGVGEVGIDAAFGCGGAIDDMLDEIFGPSECPEEDPPPAADDADTSAAAGIEAPPARRLAAFFTPPGTAR